MTSTQRKSERPILLLGTEPGERCRIREILLAAGYRVVAAGDPEESLRQADRALPRIVAVAVDAEGEWVRLLRPLKERIGRATPVVLIETQPGPCCREPSFARRLLEEIQYVERPRFMPRRAARR